MVDNLLEAESIGAEMKKPWMTHQVNWHLSDLLRWLDYGYVLTEEQKEMLGKLCKESK